MSRRRLIADSPSHSWADELRWRIATQQTVTCNFNKAPSLDDALAYLQSLALFDCMEKDDEVGVDTKVFDFVFYTPGISKRRIGELLGSATYAAARDWYVMARMPALVGLDFADALRDFLHPLWMPGEAQAIDRIMHTFAKAYCSANPEVTASSAQDVVIDDNGFTNLLTVDAAYVLSFAAVMLNTDAHSSHTISGFTRSSFVQNCSGLGVPRALVEHVWESVTSNPILHDSDNVLSPPLATSAAHIHTGGMLFPWRSRFLMLTCNKLLIFHSEESQDRALAKYPHQALQVVRLGERDITIEPHPVAGYATLDGWVTRTGLFARSDLLSRSTETIVRIRLPTSDLADKWELLINRALNTAVVEDVCELDPARDVTEAVHNHNLITSE
ncbi:uncharacterized protein AMSG_02317 [Thecamonas trahens ATCC 50062]|nr:hypothetical protein AMSG_02317 [Thecamonas trahens ATCC 50062]KNC56346.1 hypothetical protein AMSG_02317 [Thecamonas trahens ATCC 50062]|eukprot:XP_013760863.1 hypothetical protein AMSG_02317 [Thecamonas trahens ATCC 50062]